MTRTSTRLKYLAAEPIVNGVGEAADQDDPTWPRYVRTTDIAGPTSLREDTFASLPPEIARRAPLIRGDIVMTAAGTIGKSFRYEEPGSACFAGYLVRFRAGPGVDPRFISYWMETPEYWNQIEHGKVASTIENFSAGKYRNLMIEIPPLAEQRAIADYLDIEAARIEKRIEIAQHRMEITTERLVAAIELAVLGREPIPCSGAPAGPLVPVPESWSMRPNKSFLRERSELSSSGTEELLSVSHLTGVTRRSEKNVTMFLAESNEGYKLVRAGDLVINTMWAWMGALGVSEVEGIVSPAYGVYKFTDPEVDSRYFDALFRSSAYVCEMTRFSKGVWLSRLRLYPASFLSLRTPFPPVEQQRRIADQVRELRQEADRLLPLVKKELVLLRERRQALITAVVAGELEVAV